MSHITHALRQLAVRPGVSFAMILMLSLGIGSTTAIFHSISTDSLAAVARARSGSAGEPCGAGAEDGHNELQLSGRVRRDLRLPDVSRPRRAADGVCEHRRTSRLRRRGLLPTAGARRSAADMVSGSYFSMLDLPPAMGRLIGREDGGGDGESAVVAVDEGSSHRFSATIGERHERRLAVDQAAQRRSSTSPKVLDHQWRCSPGTRMIPS